MTELTVFRFAVRDDEGRQSSVFRVWRGERSSDVYIASRSVAGEIKASLHQSGRCQIALNKQYAQRPDAVLLEGGDRYFSKWKRREPSADAVRAFTIYIPTTELRSVSVEIPGKPVLWLPPAPQDYAVAVELMYTAAKVREISWRSENGSELPVIARMQLPSGESLWAVYRTVPIDSHVSKPLEAVRTRIRSNPNIRLDHDLAKSELRLVAMGNADDGSHFFIDASFAG